MSQNKTVIQGLEPDNSPMGASSGAGVNSFYSRGGGSSTPRGTVVPGMQDFQGVKSEGNAEAAPRQQNWNQSGKPIVGFLYSVSRTASAEFWPLHIGQNTIGKDPSNDIVLSEGTVSSEHAVIVVRKMKKPEKVIASISDARSTNGTMINGESLGFSAVECKNGDIITIGDNYELYLILVDAPTLGLSVSEQFIPVETEQGPEQDDSFAPGYTRPGDTFNPNNGPVPPRFNGGEFSKGTVGFDGSSLGGNNGGTVGM